MAESLLTLRGVRDGVRIFVKRDAPLDEAQRQIIERIEAKSSFFKGGRITVELEGDYDAESCDRLGEELRTRLDYTDIEVKRSIRRMSGRAFAEVPRGLIPSGEDDDARQGHTLFYTGTLYRGKRLEHPGSIVVYGDVNDGAELIAGGHIIVLGALCGSAHAGCFGDESATVSALVLAPSALRIADIMYEDADKKEPPFAERAFVGADGRITAEPCMKTEDGTRRKGGIFGKLKKNGRKRGV